MIHEVGNKRVLIIDDTPSIHESIHKLLGDQPLVDAETLADDEFLFGKTAGKSGVWQAPVYELTSAYQGKEGLDRVIASLDKKQPFAVAIVDMRMPPGWSGLETVQRIWEVDPKLLVIFCTAFSDYSWQEMSTTLGQTDRFVILKKPFDNAELQQLVAAMTQRWMAERRAEVNLEQLSLLMLEKSQLVNQVRQLQEKITRGVKCEGGASTRSLNSRKIVLVDCDSGHSTATAQVLRDAGAIVETLDNAQDALNECLMANSMGEPLDAMVVEVNLPGHDGYSLARNLRENGYQGRLLAYTNHQRPADGDACRTAGYNDWLPKSASTEELIALLAE